MSKKGQKRPSANDFQPIERTIPLEALMVDPSVNMRRRRKLDDQGKPEYERVKELMHSIKDVGLLQPPVVRELAEGEERERPIQQFQLWMGFRRISAIRKLGWTSVTVSVYPASTSDEVMYSANMVENAQREDCTTFDQAERFTLMVDKFELSAREVARRSGLTPSNVQALVRCYRHVAPKLRELWEKDDVTCPARLLIREILKADDAGEIPSAELQVERFLAHIGNKDANKGENPDPSADAESRGARLPDGSPKKPSGKMMRQALGALVAAEKGGDSDPRIEGGITALRWALAMEPALGHWFDPEAERAKAEAEKEAQKAERDRKRKIEQAARKKAAAEKMAAEAAAMEADLEEDNKALAESGGDEGAPKAKKTKSKKRTPKGARP